MGKAKRRWLFRAGFALAALVIGVPIWLAMDADKERGSPELWSDPQLVTAQALQDLALNRGWPIYWAGPIKGSSLIATEEPDDGVRLGYVKAGIDPKSGIAESGRTSGDRLAISTRPVEDPTAALADLERHPDTDTVHVGGFGRIVTDKSKPGTVYFAGPKDEVLVEVSAPQSRRALSLVRSGEVQPVG